MRHVSVQEALIEVTRRRTLPTITAGWAGVRLCRMPVGPHWSSIARLRSRGAIRGFERRFPSHKTLIVDPEERSRTFSQRVDTKPFARSCKDL